MKPADGSQRDMLDPSAGPLYLKPGEVARAVGVPPSTIRHWQEVFSGFLHPIRTSSGRHVYSQADLRTFRAIHHLVHQQGLGSQEARRRLPDLLRAPDALRTSDIPRSDAAGINQGRGQEDATPSSEQPAMVRELEARLDQARQENQHLRDELERIVRLVSDWARQIEEEAEEPSVSDPPG